eukprot:633469-Pyramimonas_sp.AAC.1
MEMRLARRSVRGLSGGWLFAPSNIRFKALDSKLVTSICMLRMGTNPVTEGMISHNKRRKTAYLSLERQRCQICSTA